MPNINVTKVIIVIAFVVTLLAMEWNEAALIAVIAGYEWKWFGRDDD